MGIICEGNISNEIIEEFGSRIRIREVDKEYNNDEYGVPIEYAKDTESLALISIMSADSSEVKEGNYSAGQIVAVFKTTDESKIKPQNRVYNKREELWYEIKSVKKNVISDILYILEATLRKLGGDDPNYETP